MDLKITQNTRNEVSKRSEIVGSFNQKTIPSRSEIRKNIAAQLNTNTKKVIVSKVDVNFGSNKGIVTARIYDDEEALAKYEPKHLIQRNKEADAPIEEVTKEESAAKTIEEEANEVAEQATQEKKE